MIMRRRNAIALLTAIVSFSSVVNIKVNAAEFVEDKDGSINEAVAYKDGKYLYEGYKGENELGIYYNDGQSEKKIYEDDIYSMDGYSKYNGQCISIPNNGKEKVINLENGEIDENVTNYVDEASAETRLYSKLKKTKKYGNNFEIKSFNKIENYSDVNEQWYSYVAEVDESKTDKEMGIVSKDDEDDNDDEYKTKIKVSICAAGGKFYIAGSKFDLAWGEKLEDFAKKIKKIKLKSGYKIISTEVKDGILEFILAADKSKDELPDGLISFEYEGTKYDMLKGEADGLEGWIQNTATIEETKNKLKKKWNTEINIQVYSVEWNEIKINKQSIPKTNDISEAVAFVNSSDYNSKLGNEYEVVANENEYGFIITLGMNNKISQVDELEELGLISIDDNNWTGLDSWPVKIENKDIISKNSNKNNNTEGDKVTYFGFADGKGNYIDCTKTANLKLYDGNSMVKIKEFNSSKKSNEKRIVVGLPTLIRTLGQDNDYIYCVVSVPVANYQPGLGTDYNDDVTSDLKFVQKISKAREDSTDSGARIPNNVSSYLIYSDSDDWNLYHVDELIGEENDVKTLIINGNILYAVEEDNGTTIRFGKMKLKGTKKIDLKDLEGDEEKVGYPVIEHDSSETTDMEDWCFDHEGNVWAINKGKIYRSRQAISFQDIYSCDRSFDRLNVYDDNNFIVWNSDTEGYATYSESKENQEPVKVVGWNKLTDGTWHLYDSQGNETVGWKNYENTWYYFNNGGVMQTGWIEDGGKKYYLETSGVMQTGWKKMQDKWYYFDGSGAMQTGWIKVQDKWYYCDQSGIMQVDTVIDGYNLGSDGAWIQ